MNINPYLPSTLIRPGSPRDAIAPVAPGSAPRDVLREQREAEQRLALSEPVRRAAEQVAERGVLVGAGLERQAQRALRAYDAVARRDEHEYVTRILGVDEFA